MRDLLTRDPIDQPLAARMRPQRLEDFVGQAHLVGPGASFRQSLEAGRIHSMILWGPPGVGKTTLALLVARYVDAHFLTLSAVLSGVKEIRAAIDEARYHRQQGRSAVLFVDEVHRFNKSQQDAFLPHIEEGTVIFIGATTENPSFELNAALLSRARVHALNALDVSAIGACIRRALALPGLWPEEGIGIDDDVVTLLARVADGDVRRAYNLLEVCASLAIARERRPLCIDEALVRDAVGTAVARFDKGGDVFYDQISALHKSVRGSSPDAALYWLHRMLEGGCDPLYVARRVVRMASEDIGNADPRALGVALDAWDVVERLGAEEGALALAQAVSFLAVAAKSNAVYVASKAARDAARQTPGLPVPLHLRNAPTRLMESLGAGVDYRYAHDFPDAYVAGECYLPPELAGTRFYDPVQRGLEIRMAEKLDRLREQDAASPWTRVERR